jgi:adiponectin receptor
MLTRSAAALASATDLLGEPAPPPPSPPSAGATAPAPPPPPAPPPRVVSAAAAPAWATLNPHLVAGYRVHHSVKDAALSILALHNETLNIASHLAGFVYFCTLLPYAMGVLVRNSAPLRDFIQFGLFFVGALAQLSTSFLYHTFRCVSARHEALFLELDIVGISMMIFASAVMGFLQGFECVPLFGFGHLLIMLVLLIVTLRFSRLAASDPKAYYGACIASLVGVVAWSAVPCVHMLSQCNGSAACRELLVSSLTRVFSLYGAGFFFFATRFPESVFPYEGTALFAQSHTIWHVFVVLAGREWLLSCLSYNTMKMSGPVPWCARTGAS